MNYNKFSNYFGLVADKKFPKFLQKFINEWYVKKFRIDLAEFGNLGDFATLNELFTRQLKKPRKLGEDFISPSDGACLECGISQNNQAFCIKNFTYNIADLLGKTLFGDEKMENFEYLNIYLSPSDYHHYHAPFDMEITALWYSPGTLFSVAPKWLKKVNNLYAKNERVVLRAILPNKKPLWLVFVGALNVGKMRFDFEPRVKTNAQNGEAFYEYENLTLKKGDHIGNFELGSTIVMVGGGIKYIVKPGDSLKFGDKIGEI